MGCFITCFGTSKHKKRLHLVDATPSTHQIHEAKEALVVTEPTKQHNIEKSINPITVSKEKLEEPLSCTSKKKVTFDVKVKTYVGVSTEDLTDVLVKNNVEKDGGKKEETPKENEESSHLPSHFPTHRYQNCANSDDGMEDTYDLDDDNDNDSEWDCRNEGGGDQILVQEESSESLFSLSIESRKQVCEVELGEKEVNSPMPNCNEQVKAIGPDRNARDRSQYVHSVLNPVENLTQWKAVKAKATPSLKYPAKENINVEQDFDVPISLEPSLRSNTKKLVDQEIAVDASLSSWLVELSETTPMSKDSNNSVGNSPPSLKDKHILGVLAIEELKQHSLSVSPRWSRSRSPGETPIIGTVGSYWSHTGQNVDKESSSPSKRMSEIRRKTKEDEKGNSNSIPFEVRLERALEQRHS
ncbi:hypothetical protein CFOL_v3_26448 [Cephalotus follicularis]|uniref:Uncharacterized protein n=1 Tax=Cephalotus follicularis TaxID=3775 RepID=A0A1Q3CRY4_CEPFO|nr:hypothetical protein CFOL_v3_26448 [Cephalotus follicularis]